MPAACLDTVAAVLQRGWMVAPGHATECRAAGSYLRAQTSSESDSELPTFLYSVSLRSVGGALPQVADRRESTCIIAICDKHHCVLYRLHRFRKELNAGTDSGV